MAHPKWLIPISFNLHTLQLYKFGQFCLDVIGGITNDLQDEVAEQAASSFRTRAQV
jgi:hypothetical protein